MYNFNKKQKIILGILVAIIAVFIFYYVYAKDENTNEQLELENNIETQEEETKDEAYSDDTILIHVSGAVVKEGLVELKVDSRILDAIDKAGGVREDASTEDINLAYKLEDGMKIHIPTKEEKEKAMSTNTMEEDKTKQHITTSSGMSDTTNNEQVKNTKVNINTATQTQLETLPGIGTSTATKIISYRKEKGKFAKIEDIKEVSGIGDAKFEKIKDLISIK